MDDDELNNLFGMDGDGDSDSEGGAGSVSDDKGSTDLGSLSVMQYEEESGSEDSDSEVITDEALDELFEEEPSDEAEYIEEQYTEDDDSWEDAFFGDDDEPIKPKRPSITFKKPDFSALDSFPLSAQSMLIILVAILFVVGFVLIAALDAFKLMRIEVEGNYHLSDEYVIEKSGLTYGRHLFLTDYYGAAQAIIKSTPYVRDCSLSFNIPSTIIIKVDERSKIANVRTPDGYASIDDEGIVLDMSSSAEASNVQPVISGLRINHASVGKKIVFADVTDYQKALIVLGSLLAADTNNPGGKYKIFENTKEVRILPSGIIFLTIKLPNRNTLQVKLDSMEQISADTAWLLYAIESKVFNDGFPSGALDMTGEEYIYREFHINDDQTENQ